MSESIPSLARRVVEAKAKGDELPLPIGAANAGRVNTWLVYDKRDVESLVVQLCEAIVAMGLTESERAAIGHLVDNVLVPLQVGERPTGGVSAFDVATLDKLRGVK